MKLRYWRLLFFQSLTCLAVTAGIGTAAAQVPQGAVYVQTNALDGNAIAAFGRNLDGTLFHIGDFATGGLGSTEFDGDEGLDPLISADSVIAVQDEQFLVTVNAGSDTVTSFRIESDFSLTKITTISSGGVGPNSLAYSNGRLFVSNIDRDGFALGDPGTPRAEPNDEGSITGFFMNESGILAPLADSTIALDNRPASVGFSADGSKLIVTSITAGSAALPGPDAANSVAVYEVDADGSVGGMVGSATGTVAGNAEGRNLASAIDFDTAVIGDREFVVVTEAREFNSLGEPPALPALQAGSVSVYELLANGSLVSTEPDFALGNPLGSPFDPSNALTTCWIDFGIDGSTFYVASTINAAIGRLELLGDGTLNLIEQTAASGVSGFANGGTTGPEVFGTTDGFIDLDVTSDGKYLYQLQGLSGAISAYAIEDGSLTLIQDLTGFLPEVDTQGLVSVSGPPIEGAVYTMTNGLLSNEVVAFGINPGGEIAFAGSFPTGGAGSTEFDGDEGLDPLISADSIIVTEDECLVCVNAGSDTISSFTIEDDFTSDLVSTISSGGVGPNSLAYSEGRLFVSNIDRDGIGLGDPAVPRGEPNDEGSITGFTINENGILAPIAGSTVNLDNRPASIGFSADGTKLIVTSITAGSAALVGPNAANSVTVFGVDSAGSITGMVGSATGTEAGNAEGRNLASAIDFDTAVIGDREFVVVTEAREFNSLGGPPALPALQAGSVSVYELLTDGSLVSTEPDFALGDPLGSPFDPANALTTCWIDFGSDGSTFYVASTINAAIGRLELLSDGTLNLIEQVAASGVSGFANGGTTGPEVFGTTDGFIDLDVTEDGSYLYQLQGLDGAISAYAINADNSLTFVQEASGFLPEVDTQGLVTFQRDATDGTGVGPNGEEVLLGDFDLDGDVDLTDLDQYNGNIGAAAVGALAALDLNGNGTVDFEDFETHFTSLVETSNGQDGTFAGDANLDGTVDVIADAFALIGNLGLASTSWSQGDFNADNTVTILADAFVLIANLGNSTQ